MKNIKKTLSLILAVLMIVTAVPLQSFAISGIFTSPIERLEFADSLPISNKAVQHKAISGGDTVSVNFMESGYNYKVVAYRKNGKVTEPAFSSMYVNVSECAEAISQDRKTVSVYVRAYFTDFTGRITDYFEQTLEKEIVEEIVKDITLIGDVPEYDEFGLYDAFVGKEFEIEYADGSKETAKVVYNEYNYYLAGNPISFDDGLYDGHEEIDPVTGETLYYQGIQVNYIDAETTLNKKAIPCPFESIELTGYKLGENAKLAEVSYTAKRKDGTTVEKTVTTESIKADSFGNNTVIDTLDGYDVTTSYYSGISGFNYDAEGRVSLTLGYEIWGISDSDVFLMTDYCNCICHKKGLSYIVYMIMSYIWNQFNINEECKCGTWHW